MTDIFFFLLKSLRVHIFPFLPLKFYDGEYSVESKSKENRNSTLTGSVSTILHFSHLFYRLHFYPR